MIIWVDAPASVRRHWDIDGAVNWMDQFTGSDMRNSWNPRWYAGTRGIIFREKTIVNAWAAVTIPGVRAYIYLNPQRRGYGATTKKRIVAHELGHVLGLYLHSPTHGNLMHANVTGGGWALSAAQRAILRAH